MYTSSSPGDGRGRQQALRAAGDLLARACSAPSVIIVIIVIIISVFS